MEGHGTMNQSRCWPSPTISGDHYSPVTAEGHRTMNHSRCWPSLTMSGLSILSWCVEGHGTINHSRCWPSRTVSVLQNPLVPVQGHGAMSNHRSSGHHWPWKKPSGGWHLSAAIGAQEHSPLRCLWRWQTGWKHSACNLIHRSSARNFYSRDLIFNGKTFKVPCGKITSLVNPRVAKNKTKQKTKYVNLRLSCKMKHAKMKPIIYKWILLEA